MSLWAEKWWELSQRIPLDCDPPPFCCQIYSQTKGRPKQTKTSRQQRPSPLFEHVCDYVCLSVLLSGKCTIKGRLAISRALFFWGLGGCLLLTGVSGNETMMMRGRAFPSGFFLASRQPATIFWLRVTIETTHADLIFGFFLGISVDFFELCMFLFFPGLVIIER